MQFDGVRADGILWIYEQGDWVPVCPKHYLRMQLTYNGGRHSVYECLEDRQTFNVPRESSDQKEYIQNKLDAKDIQKRKFLNIDGESIAIAEDGSSSRDNKYFVRAILTDSKIGQRLVVYAGEKGKEKTQIFVEPDIKRLAFDQTNTHPSEIFIKLEGTFDDGSTASIKQPGQ